MGIDLDSLYELYMGYMGYTVSRVFIQDTATLTEIQSIAAVELKKDELSKNIEFSPHTNAKQHPVDDTQFITLWNNLIGYKIDSVIILETMTRNKPVNKILKVAFKASIGSKIVEFNENGKIALKRLVM
ncbi:hypothetical protein LGK95_13050 [Clostridium algoriphilum]|uniref:hypothetical protein n=1 Tax=Clostridium algoriphilum TaxID=198347 RepID=UPI001CF1AF59|nr:hypothetical protein [Clostridium algoriphilum]MCB2294437.1 hypothetical protein [Clostridium algoriphilum]